MDLMLAYRFVKIHTAQNEYPPIDINSEAYNKLFLRLKFFQRPKKKKKRNNLLCQLIIYMAHTFKSATPLRQCQ